jgi:hypothetical protein
MAMSELKQKLLLNELAQNGLTNVVYEPQNDAIKIQTDNDGREILIYDDNEIRYLQANRETALFTVRPLVGKVNEMTAAFENAAAVPIENLSRFRVLAEYNNIIMAARDDTDNGRGLNFVTWQYDYNRTGLEHGHYTEDYESAKEDFSIRAGLIPKEKIVTREQAAEIIAAIENLIDYDLYLTSEKELVLNKIVENLRDAYPKIRLYEDTEREEEPQYESDITPMSAVKENDDITAEPQNEKHAELIERVNKNLKDYHDTLDGFGIRELIDMAEKISAVSGVHNYMCYRGFDDDELDFLLQFQNPLEVAAESWREYQFDVDDEMGFAFDNVFRHKQDWLESYPLMSDMQTTESSQDTSLRRYMDIDLELYLGKIAEKVIIHYPDDWNIDLKTLHRAAVSDNPDDKRLMWHVCGYGTHLNTERETFIKDTGAFNTWVDYRPRDDDMFGYAVEVTGYDGGIIKGNVFEVGDYYAHSLYVRENALLLDSVSLTYADDWGVNAGKTITVAKFEYDEQRRQLMSESGNVTAIEYHPWEAMKTMSDLMRHERAKRMALPIGSTRELLRKMADKLNEVRKETEPQHFESNKLLFGSDKTVVDERDFENGMTAILPNADIDSIKTFIEYAKELDDYGTIGKSNFFNDTLIEFYLVKHGYGEEAARQLLDICKTSPLNPFEIRGAAYLLTNGTEPSKIGQIAVDIGCDPPDGEPFSTQEALEAFENGTLYNKQNADSEVEINNPPEAAEKTNPAIQKQKPKTLAEKMQAAKEKVKAQDAQDNDKKSRKREERE